MDAVRKVRIGMAGCGTVGGGVVALLAQQGDAIARRCGVALQLDRVLVRDLDRDRSVKLPGEVLTTEASALLAPDIDLVIEVLG
ncbi:MAG: homoserine dehydrogenase, partial [Planctomycetes bacterium]|nr:homoserine dehydrogenase [Planctomycetota bacterium]